MIIKKEELNEEGLIRLQLDIENLSTHYESYKSIYQASPDLLKLLINDEMTAKEFMKNQCVNPNYIKVLNHFGEYTFEGIMVHVLGMLFNETSLAYPSVKLITLLEQLDRVARLQSDEYRAMMQSHFQEEEVEEVEVKTPKGSMKSTFKVGKRYVSVKRYGLGIMMVEFLLKRKLIVVADSKMPDPEEVITRNQKGEYYIKRSTYVICNFHLDLLPVKLNLPMVSKPIKWDYRPSIKKDRSMSMIKKILKYTNTNKKKKEEAPSAKTITDLSGGYYSCLSHAFYYPKCKLITSKDHEHFKIDISGHEYGSLLRAMNTLQDQGFHVNTALLSIINDHYECFVEAGLLEHPFLSQLNMTTATELLRSAYLAKKRKKKMFQYGDALNEFYQRVQRSRYESQILTLADAYSGYTFYLPAFLDFRGRIYRAGVLHFHERDLSRSLILFANVDKNPRLRDSSGIYREFENEEEKREYDERIINTLKIAAAFHVRKHESNKAALDWFRENIESPIERIRGERVVSPESKDMAYLIGIAKSASNPLQFISNVLCAVYKMIDVDVIPITQDASASAYQIISFLLLNQDLARATNLIPHEVEYIDSTNAFHNLSRGVNLSSDDKTSSNHELNLSNSPCQLKEHQIQDFYSEIRVGLLEHLKGELGENQPLYQIISKDLPRSLVKSIFMPMVYGKKEQSMCKDIHKYYSTLLKRTEFSKIASACRLYYLKAFGSINLLMRLVSLLAWFTTTMEKPIRYAIPWFTTVQDYMVMENIPIKVYSYSNKARKKAYNTLSLSISTETRDRRKSSSATFANFIHQMDAQLAMNMIITMLKKDLLPIYTVHENFITTARNIGLISNIYSDLFTKTNPIERINWFITINILNPTITPGYYSEGAPIEWGKLKLILDNRMALIRKKDRAAWKNKTTLLEVTYSDYIRSIGYYPQCEDPSRNERWDAFVKALKAWEGYKVNNSLHL